MEIVVKRVNLAFLRTEAREQGGTAGRKFSKRCFPRPFQCLEIETCYARHSRQRQTKYHNLLPDIEICPRSIIRIVDIRVIECNSLDRASLATSLLLKAVQRGRSTPLPIDEPLRHGFPFNNTRRDEGRRTGPRESDDSWRLASENARHGQVTSI